MKTLPILINAFANMIGQYKENSWINVDDLTYSDLLSLKLGETNCVKGPFFNMVMVSG